MKETHVMKEESIRITVNIPAPLYRELIECAAVKGRSIPELILAGIRTVLVEGQRRHPRKVQFPLIVSKGRKVNVTNDRIYRHVEFP
ncbi:MAG: hypothetical protein ABSD63_10680 [Candidatus Korobacteraceae bacterium]